MLFLTLDQVTFIVVLGVCTHIVSSALVTVPRIKYIKEGQNGTIAACFQSNGDSGLLTPIFSEDIRWHWLNSTAKVQLPNTSTSSNIWSNGYTLKAVNVGPIESGNYCCLIDQEDTTSCDENAITQLIVAVTPQLIIDNSVVNGIHGRSAQLTCNHTNPNSTPIRVRWYKNNSRLFTGEKYTISVIQQLHSYTLQVHNVTESDEGIYSCVADSLHSSKSVGHIKFTVPNDTSSTVEAAPLYVTSLTITLPIGIKCESVQQTQVNVDLQKHITSMCNCTDIAVINTFFECRGSSQASYSIVITGEDALLAAAVLNHSLNREEHFTTETGIQFSAYNSTKLSNTITSTPTINSEQHDDGITPIHLTILTILTLVLLILGMITGFAAGWGCKSWWTEDQTKSDTNDMHHSEVVNIQPNLRNSIHSTVV